MEVLVAGVLEVLLALTLTEIKVFASASVVTYEDPVALLID